MTERDERAGEVDLIAPLRELVEELRGFDVLIHPVPHGIDVPDDYERGVNDAGVRAKAVLEQIELRMRLRPGQPSPPAADPGVGVDGGGS